MPDDLLTTADVVRISGYPAGSVNRWAAEGSLPVVQKLNGRTGANLYRRADVEAFFARRGDQVAA